MGKHEHETPHLRCGSGRAAVAGLVAVDFVALPKAEPHRAPTSQACVDPQAELAAHAKAERNADSGEKNFLIGSGLALRHVSRAP